MKKLIIVVSHGRFAQEIVKSAEMIIGTIHDCHAFSLTPDMGIEQLVEKIENCLKENEDKEVICLIDLFGGTPCFSAMSLLDRYDFKAVTGLNLAMLIEVVSQRSALDLDSLANRAIEVLQNSGTYLNEYIRGGR